VKGMPAVAPREIHTAVALFAADPGAVVECTCFGDHDPVVDAVAPKVRT
jgi:hypothetical protein